MNVFRFRPLALACLGFIVSLTILYYVNTTVKVIFLSLALSGLFIILALYLIKRGNTLRDIAVFLTPLLSFFVISSIISLFVFTPLENQARYSGEQIKELEGYITQVINLDNEESIYIAELEKINDDDVSFKIALYTEGKILGYGDYFKAQGQITAYNNLDSPYLEYGVLYYVDAMSCLPQNKEPNAPLAFLQEMNKTLSKRFEDNLSSDTSSLFSALLLGNKAGLSGETKNNFSTLGISHFLALSGIHLSILVSIISFLLDLFSVPRVAKGFTIVLAVAFFMGLTGFSSSILRAGIMLILFYLIRLFGSEPDRITCLFVSVALICLFSPFAVFSVSLRLSFLAMLGCIVGSRLTRKSDFLRRFKLKPVYHGIVTLIVTIIVVLFTLPVLCNDFGTIALLSPVANLIFVPIFNLLIYLSLIFILFCQVPFIGGILATISDLIVGKLLELIDWASSIPNTVLTVNTPIQVIGALIIFVSMVLLLVGNKYFFRKSLLVTLIGAVILIGGTAGAHIRRNDGVTIGTLGYTRNDIFYVEANGTLAFFDMTSTPFLSLANQVKYTSRELGYEVIDSYVITDYCESTQDSLTHLFESIDIKSLYLAVPTTIEDKEVYGELVRIAGERGTYVYAFEDGAIINGMEISLICRDGIYASESRMTCISLLAGEKRLTYVGSSAFSSGDKSVYEMCYYSNVIIMGSHGPTYREVYNFEAPNLENIIFLGKTRDFCNYRLFKELEPISNRTTDHRAVIKYGT